MADIKDRISKIQPYFREMQVVTMNNEQVIYVVVDFPEKWVIDENILNKYNVSIAEDETYNSRYYFCANMEVGFDAVFDSIEGNIVKMQTAEERATLFRTKVEELKQIFSDDNNTVEMLRGIEFTMGKKKKSSKDKTMLDNVVDETYTDNE